MLTEGKDESCERTQLLEDQGDNTQGKAQLDNIFSPRSDNIDVKKHENSKSVKNESPKAKSIMPKSPKSKSISPKSITRTKSPRSKSPKTNHGTKSPKSSQREPIG